MWKNKHCSTKSAQHESGMRHQTMENVVFHTSTLYCSAFPAFGAISGPLGIHVYIQTALQFTSAEPRPRLLGGPEFTSLVCIRVWVHIHTSLNQPNFLGKWKRVLTWAKEGWCEFTPILLKLWEPVADVCKSTLNILYITCQCVISGKGSAIFFNLWKRWAILCWRLLCILSNSLVKKKSQMHWTKIHFKHFSCTISVNTKLHRSSTAVW